MKYTPVGGFPLTAETAMAAPPPPAAPAVAAAAAADRVAGSSSGSSSGGLITTVKFCVELPAGLVVQVALSSKEYVAAASTVGAVPSNFPKVVFSENQLGASSPFASVRVYTISVLSGVVVQVDWASSEIVSPEVKFIL